jgi:hypothetical protein
MAQNESFPPAAVGIAAADLVDPPAAPDPARQTRAAEAAPPGRRRKPRPRLARSIVGLLHRIILAAKGLSPREFSRVLAGVLLIVGMMVAIFAMHDVSPMGVVFFAVVFAALIIVLVKDEAVKKALIIMGIAVTGIVAVAVAPSISRFLDTHINAQPVPGPAVQRRTVSGTVVDEAGRPLADVRVRTDGDATFVRTDAAGRFTLTVLESSIHDNRVEFYLVRAQHLDVVSQALASPLALVFDGRVEEPADPSPAALAGQNALMVSPRTRGAPGQAAVAVIVDSIYTVFDGSWVGEADWSFDVSVPDGTPIHIRKATYSNQVEHPRRVMVVGTETDVPLAGDSLMVTVRGVREVLPFMRYRLRGSLQLGANAIAVDQPLRQVILVQDGPKWNNGSFRFYITLLKLPALPGTG